jgi:hypothetical protein
MGGFGVLALVLLLLVILVYKIGCNMNTQAPVSQTEHLMDTSGFSAHVGSVDKLAAAKKAAHIKSFNQMSEGEKVQFIIDTYFVAVSDEDVDTKKQQQENDYINSLPLSGTGATSSTNTTGQTCTDDYDDCQTWAQNGECTINPEFMLYSCPNACRACNLTPQQKQNVTVIYNSRKPAGKVYHGENYPGNFPYLNRMYTYNVHYT